MSLWFRNLSVFPLAADFDKTNAQLDVDLNLLALGKFIPPGSNDLYSQGWVPPAAHRGDEYGIVYSKGALLVALRTDEKILPAGVVRQMADERIKQVESEENRKVGRRETREMRDRVAEELLPKAFTKTTVQRAIIDIRAGFVFIEGSSANRAENLLSLLRQTLGTLPARRINTNTSPQTAMTAWLQGGTPEGFELDADCELRFPGDGGAIARFAHQALEADEVRQNLATGKLVSKLGLVWKDRIAFAMTDKLEFKRLTMLDVLQEEIENAEATDQAALFDSSLAMLVGELRELVPAVIGALGGEVKS